MSNPAFWMVLAEGHTYTHYRHPTEQSAKNEAQRLAGLNPNQKFHVLACIGHAIRKSPVEWVEAEVDLDSEIPF